MGEFLRKYVLRRLLAFSEGEIAALISSMRQIGVRIPGGAEALAIFHQLLYGEWMTGSLSGPLARIKVDEKNCFGMIEWQAVREAASRCLSKHTAAAAWKHRNLSHVEHEELAPMPKDVDGLLEVQPGSGHGCNQKREDELLPTRRQANCHGFVLATPQTCSACKQITRPDNRKPRISSKERPENFTGADDPWHALQKNGGLADLWYMDRGDVLYHPILVPSNLQEFDIANAKVGAERNPQKTEVICYVNDLDTAPILSVGSSMCRRWSRSQQQPLGASHSESLSDLGSASRTSSWPGLASFEQCTNEFIRESLESQPHQSHFAGARSYDPAGATRSCRSNLRRLKSTTRGSSRVGTA